MREPPLPQRAWWKVREHWWRALQGLAFSLRWERLADFCLFRLANLLGEIQETWARADRRPVPACEDCATLGELCAACGLFIYGLPGREGPCSACPHPGEEHLFFSGLCTAEGCDCIEHEPRGGGDA